MAQTPHLALHQASPYASLSLNCGSPPASPKLLEPPNAATAPLSWGRGIVLDIARHASGHPR